MNYRYALANYYLSIANDNDTVKNLFGDVRIGGEGDAVASITINTSATLWATRGYATGAWVHTKNLDRTGTIEISISQLTDAVAKFKTFVSLFYSTNNDRNRDIQGSTITLNDSFGNKVCTCYDCYPTKIPSQAYADSAGEQAWSFTCGKIDFE